MTWKLRSVGWLAFLGLSSTPQQLMADISNGPLTRRYSKALQYDYSPASPSRSCWPRRQRSIVPTSKVRLPCSSGQPKQRPCFGKPSTGRKRRAECIECWTSSRRRKSRNAARSRRVRRSSHGKISNPHNKAKQNEQLHEAAAYENSAKLVLQAMMRSEEFREFAFPAQIAPPMLTRYKPGMSYGAHADAAFLQFRMEQFGATSAAPSSSTSRRTMRAGHSTSGSRTGACASS